MKYKYKYLKRFRKRKSDFSREKTDRFFFFFFYPKDMLFLLAQFSSVKKVFVTIRVCCLLCLLSGPAGGQDVMKKTRNR